MFCNQILKKYTKKNSAGENGDNFQNTFLKFTQDNQQKPFSFIANVSEIFLTSNEDEQVCTDLL